MFLSSVDFFLSPTSSSFGYPDAVSPPYMLVVSNTATALWNGGLLTTLQCLEQCSNPKTYCVFLAQTHFLALEVLD